MKTKIKMSIICEVITVAFLVAWLIIHKNHSGLIGVVLPWLLASSQFENDAYIQNSKGDKIFLFVLLFITLLLSSVLLFMFDEDSFLYTIQIAVGGVWIFLNGRTHIRNEKTGYGLILTLLGSLIVISMVIITFF